MLNTTNNAAEVVELSVVRLADASHARVLVLEARGLDGSVVVVCGPPGLDLGGGGGGGGGGGVIVEETKKF